MSTQFRELQRRNVFRTALLYLVTSWLIIQIADVVLDLLGVPDWGLRLVFALLLLGFPIALLFSWAYEVTPAGLRRDVGPDAAHPEAAHTGKKLDLAVIFVVLIGIAVVASQGWLGDRPSPGEPRVGQSIAVLPFRDLSEGADNSYFTEGLSQALVHDLTQIRELKVAPRSGPSAREMEMREIGETLNVSTILDGSVRKSGDRLKVTAQLIDVRDGFTLWSDSYDAELKDIFRIQDRIAQSIAEALRLQLLPDQVRETGPGTQDPVAYEAFLEAQGALELATTEADYDTAISLLTEALRTDPLFEEAEAKLCSAYWGKYEQTRDTAYVNPALSSCQRAQILFPESADVLTALGNIYQGTGRTEFAIRNFEQAITLDPDNTDALRGLASALDDAGQHDAALEKFERAIATEPRNWQNFSALGYVHYRSGNFEEALDAYGKALAIYPKNPSLWSNVGGIFFLQGRFSAAADAFVQSLSFEPTATAYSNAGTNFYYAGEFARSREMFEQAVDLAPSEYRFVGNLGDVCRMLDGCAAKQHYRRALELARAELRIDPGNAPTIALTALYLAHLGEQDEAEQTINLARERDAENLEVLWYTGICYAVLGKNEAAIAALEAAVAGGYPPTLVAADPLLAHLSEAFASTGPSPSDEN